MKYIIFLMIACLCSSCACKYAEDSAFSVYGYGIKTKLVYDASIEIEK